MTAPNKQLKYFSESAGIFPGRNYPAFSKLEYLIDILNNKNRINHIGLFGSASVGKTTASQIFAKEVNAEFIYINCASFTNTSQLIDLLLASTAFPSKPKIDLATNQKYIAPDNRVVICFDEAHMLSKKLQNELLSALDPNTLWTGLNNPKTKLKVCLSSTSCLFATTNKSRLLGPLVSRLVSVIFIPYEAYDMEQILETKFPDLSSAARQAIAQSSKYVPRAAIKNAEMLIDISGFTPDEFELRSFFSDFLHVSLNGLDAIDASILEFLAADKEEASMQPLIDANIRLLETNPNLSNAEKETLLATNNMLQQIDTSKLSTKNGKKSYNDIMVACNIIDKQEVIDRVSYLCSLQLVKRGPNGIFRL